ncbi:MAG TPA: hypothetical protein VGC14_02725 [Rhizobium sp.]
MTEMKVFKDASGAIINIGDWDYGEETILVDQSQDVTSEIPTAILGADGSPIMKTVTTTVTTTVPQTIQTNPLPADAVETTADIVTGWDGGLYASDNPRRLAPT